MLLGDIFASHVVRVVAGLRKGSQSVSPMNFAEDLVSGIDFLDEEQCIRRFYPQDLPLFDLVLLADVVHDKAPIYSLFANQCYWYANILFEAVIQRYSLSSAARRPVDTDPYPTPGPSTGPSPTGVPAPIPEIDAPENANLLILPAPGKAGRWYGVLLTDPIVRQTVTASIISDFETRLAFYLSTVIFHQILIAHERSTRSKWPSSVKCKIMTAHRFRGFFFYFLSDALLETALNWMKLLFCFVLSWRAFVCVHKPMESKTIAPEIVSQNDYSVTKFGQGEWAGTRHLNKSVNIIRVTICTPFLFFLPHPASPLSS
jgi:hypothetical protein